MRLKKKSTNTLNTQNKVFSHVFLVIVSIFLVMPFLWMIITSLKSDAEIVQVPPTLVPSDPVFSNYSKALDTLPFLSLYKNTFLRIIFRILFATVFSSMAGYAFARYKFPGRNFLFALVIFQLMIPTQIFLIPQYLMVAKLKLANTVFALVFPGLVSAFGTFLMRQFFAAIPKELDEAAVLDGCNPWQIYWYILLPLVKPGMAALGIFTAIFAWKDMMWPLIINQALDKLTISAAMGTLASQIYYGQKYSVFMAASTMATIPVIIIFVIFQRRFIQNIASTGIKG